MLVFLLLPKNTANQVFKFICLNDIKEEKSKCFFISNNTTWYFKGEVSNYIKKYKIRKSHLYLNMENASSSAMEKTDDSMKKTCLQQNS